MALRSESQLRAIAMMTATLLTKLVALMVWLLLYATGAAKRRSPVGGFANGMPRYSLTCVAFGALCPSSRPVTRQK